MHQQKLDSQLICLLTVHRECSNVAGCEDLVRAAHGDALVAASVGVANRADPELTVTGH